MSAFREMVNKHNRNVEVRVSRMIGAEVSVAIFAGTNDEVKLDNDVEECFKLRENYEANGIATSLKYHVKFDIKGGRSLSYAWNKVRAFMKEQGAVDPRSEGGMGCELWRVPIQFDILAFRQMVENLNPGVQVQITIINNCADYVVVYRVEEEPVLSGLFGGINI